jgi:hypothetical protein
LRNFLIRFLAIISRKFGLHYYNQAAMWWRDQDFNIVWKKFSGANKAENPVKLASGGGFVVINGTLE